MMRPRNAMSLPARSVTWMFATALVRVNYTNASAILAQDFRDTEDSDGLFSGRETEKASTDQRREVRRRGTEDGRADLRRSSTTPHLAGRNIIPEFRTRARGSVLLRRGLDAAHTIGVQHIRTPAIIQLLMDNMGRPGGGIMALRGHASIQGSTDIPTIYNLLPGAFPCRARTAIEISLLTTS